MIIIELHLIINWKIIITTLRFIFFVNINHFKYSFLILRFIFIFKL